MGFSRKPSTRRRKASCRTTFQTRFLCNCVGTPPAFSREDYAAGPAQFIRYMAREWSATQSQYIGMNKHFAPDGLNVTTNGRAVAGSLIFGEKLCDWCIRELFPEAAPRRREEGMIYTVTHYKTDGKSIVEVAEWPDRTEAEAAMDHREEEIGGRRGHSPIVSPTKACCRTSFWY